MSKFLLILLLLLSYPNCEALVSMPIDLSRIEQLENNEKIDAAFAAMQAVREADSYIHVFMIGCIDQSHGLLSFFEEIKSDSIVNTLDWIGNIPTKDIPEHLSIRYFFGNNAENLYAIGETYNMDENTYTEFIYKRTVEASFSKTIDKITILCYWLDDAYYLAIYDKSENTIVSKYSFFMPTDYETGEAFTQSILFPNNYIFTIETTHDEIDDSIKTRVKFVEIDYVNKKFIEHKNVLMEGYMVIEDMHPDNEKYQKAIELAGISKEGEL